MSLTLAGLLLGLWGLPIGPRRLLQLFVTAALNWRREPLQNPIPPPGL